MAATLHGNLSQRERENDRINATSQNASTYFHLLIDAHFPGHARRVEINFRPARAWPCIAHIAFAFLFDIPSFHGAHEAVEGAGWRD